MWNFNPEAILVAIDMTISAKPVRDIAIEVEVVAIITKVSFYDFKW